MFETLDMGFQNTSCRVSIFEFQLSNYCLKIFRTPYWNSKHHELVLGITMLAFVNARAIPFKRCVGYLKLLLKHAESMGFPITRNGCSPGTPTFGVWRSNNFYCAIMLTMYLSLRLQTT
jgi:hypothetical protein